jgi:quercetin dioxygenase-like cupin family protein
MLSRENWTGLSAILFTVILGGYGAVAKVHAQAPQAKHEHSRVAFSHALPSLNGDHLEATIVEVNYGPGESSAPHTHPCAVIGYIVRGTYRTQVKGEPEAIYQAGESFYEAPNGVHQVSANASAKDPLKFLVYFTCDHQAPLSTDVSENKSAGEKP